MKKGLEKTLWIIITAVVAIVVLYILIKIGVISIGKFDLTAQESIKSSKDMIKDVLKNITKG